MACCGDTPTLETLAAVTILRDAMPELKIRVVNVVDLMKLEPNTKHPHGLTDADYDALFTKDKPIIFAFHGYPTLVHAIPLLPCLTQYRCIGRINVGLVYNVGGTVFSYGGFLHDTGTVCSRFYKNSKSSAFLYAAYVVWRNCDFSVSYLNNHISFKKRTGKVCV